MHILVATDGTLDPERAATAVARWYEEGDEVSVFTAINVPSDFLEHIDDPGVKQAVQVALEAGQGIGDRAAEALAPPHDGHVSPPVDSPVVRGLTAEARRRTQPVVAALKERGIAADHTWTTTDNRTAKSIVTAIHRHDSGLVVIGSHGHGRFEGLLGSTGTKLVRSPASGLVIRDRGADEGPAVGRGWTSRWSSRPE